MDALEALQGIPTRGRRWIRILWYILHSVGLEPTILRNDDRTLHHFVWRRQTNMPKKANFELVQQKTYMLLKKNGLISVQE